MPVLRYDVDARSVFRETALRDVTVSVTETVEYRVDFGHTRDDCLRDPRSVTARCPADPKRPHRSTLEAPFLAR